MHHKHHSRACGHWLPVIAAVWLAAVSVIAAVPATCAAANEKPNVIYIMGDEARQKKHEHLYWEYGGTRAVRMGKWKAVGNPRGGRFELYDLEADLGEVKNVAAGNPEIVERMRKIMETARVDPPERRNEAAVAATRNGFPVPAEGNLEAFLGGPKFELQQVFAGDRFPNVVVAADGTVLAFWNGVKVRRSEDGGKTWGNEILVGKGFMGGGVTVDENSGDILAFVESQHPPAAVSVYRSADGGKTWKAQETVIHPDRNGNVPSMHMNEHGITLRHGKHKGRLLRPTRWYAGKNEQARWPQHYTNAVYSDDGGKTWKTSDPFPANGTGEATLAELSDGRIYYNSRRHWAPKGENARRRWTAWSEDGGQTWKDLSICKVLPDGDQVRDYGLMGGLVRLPVEGRDVLIFSNIESPAGRHHGTVWASFDGGKTWPVKRLVFEGPFAYSSLNAGRPKTPGEGWIYLQFEGGPKGGGTVARFNLSWLLEGEKTGDGKLPQWASLPRPTE